MVRRQAAVLALAVAVTTALWLLAPLLPEPSTIVEFRIGTYGGVTLFFALVGAIAAIGVALAALLRTRVLVLAAVIAFAVAMALNLADVAVASDLVKIAFGVLVGAGVVRAIERPWWFLPVTICVPLADAWSVFAEHGVTKAVVDKAAEEPRWIDWPTIAVPIPGFDYDAFGRLGTTDIFFLALFLAAAQRWNLGARRLAVVLPLTFVGSIVAVNEWIDTAVPALPLLCVAFLLLAFPGMWRDLRTDLAAR